MTPDGFPKAYCAERVIAAEEHRNHLTTQRELYASRLVIYNALDRYSPAEIHRLAVYIQEMDSWGVVEDLAKSSADVT